MVVPTRMTLQCIASHYRLLGRLVLAFEVEQGQALFESLRGYFEQAGGGGQIAAAAVERVVDRLSGQIGGARQAEALHEFDQRRWGDSELEATRRCLY